MLQINIVGRNVVLVLLWFLFLFPAFQIGSDALADEDGRYVQGVEGADIFKGRVRSVSVEDGILTVRPRKGKKVEFSFTEQTVFVGFISLDEIEDNKDVTVWYFNDGEINQAVKIEKLPEQGC